MIRFAGRGILLDIEGTTSSTHFVYETLFPFAQSELGNFLRGHWGQPEVDRALDALAADGGLPSRAAWLGKLDRDAAIESVRDLVDKLMEADAKLTGLKQMQGLVWREGYRKGLLKSHVYDDVPPALERWTKAGLDLRIFSSGSVVAQTQFFEHTELGDLERYFKGHYDTTTGPKRVADSYRAIAADFKLPEAEILFLSDVVAELDAARSAGMPTALVVRHENAPIPDKHQHAVIEAFDEIKLTAPQDRKHG